MVGSHWWTWQRGALIFAVGAAIAIASGVLELAAFPEVFLAKLFLIVVIGSVVVLGVGRRLVGDARAKQVYLGLVVVAVSTVLCLLAAEFVVRFLFRDVTTTGDNSSYFADRYWAANPPSKNSLGFREREFQPFPGPHTFRIAIVGDSFTYGQGIPETARVSNLLEQRLSSDNRSFEVLNFGISGAETADEFVTLTQYVLPSHPDFVVLQWFVNDIDDHTTTPRAKPFLFLPSETLSRVLHQRSALYYLVEQEWKRAVQSRNAEDLKFDPDGTTARNYRDLLVRFIETAELAHAPIAIMVYPQLHDVDGSPSNYPQGDLINFVLQVCSNQNITCFDLRNVFAPVAPAVKLWASRLDSHPGPLANERVTDALIQGLAARWVGLADGLSRGATTN